MSRLIVKNIPKFAGEKELTAFFGKVGQVTDCKVAEKNGLSRRFCFIGYKTPEEAQKAQQYFNGTYMGTSKVLVQFAKTKGELLAPEEKHSKRQKTPRNERQAPLEAEPQVKRKFDDYKQLIQKGSKQSWNDLLVGADAVAEEEPIKKTKKLKQETKEEKIAAKQAGKAKEAEKKAKAAQPAQFNPIHIKAPVLSQRNEQFIRGPLKVDETRLFVTNFPYTVSEEEVVKVFGRYGVVTKAKLPKGDGGNLKGYGFITYEKPEEALRAFSELDNKIVFGKILHIKPALQDIGGIIKNKKEEQYQQMIKEKYGDPLEDKSSYKKKKKLEMRRRLDDTTSWNTLFLNPNTLLQHMAEKHGVDKSEILESDQLAVRVALAETEVIEETRQWMKSEGLNLSFLDTDRNLCERSKNIILVKNLNYNTQPNDLRELFNFYGIVDRVLLCPNKTIGIVEYQSEQFAKNAFEKLSYFKFKNQPLYLEWAPVDLLTREKVLKRIEQQKIDEENTEELSKVLYVKNLNFKTTEEELKKHLAKAGQTKSVKIMKDRDGKPRGFGFVEFPTKEAVIKAIKLYQNSLLDGHTLQLSVSKKKVEPQANRRKKQQLGFEPKSAKLVVRNVAFEASKQDIRELFKEFGTIKGIRLPKKMDGQHRGFAFIEYETIEEAMQAYASLGSSHLYGRKLVIEWEESSTQL